MHLLELGNDAVDLVQECFAADMGRMRDQFRRVVGQSLIPRHAGPTPNLEAGKQCQPTHVAPSARIQEVAEQILQSELDLLR